MKNIKLKSTKEEYSTSVNKILADARNSECAQVTFKRLEKYFAKDEFDKTLEQILDTVSNELKPLRLDLTDTFIYIPSVNVPISNNLALLLTFIVLL